MPMLHGALSLSAWNVFDDLRDGVLVATPAGELVYGNMAATRLLGLTGLPATMAELSTLLAAEPVDHLLEPPAESYLSAAQGPLHLRARPLNVADREYAQIVIAPVARGGTASLVGDSASISLAALTRIVRRLNDTLQLEEILQLILNEAILLSEAAGGAFFLWERTKVEVGQPLVSRGQPVAPPEAGDLLQAILAGDRPRQWRPRNGSDGDDRPRLAMAVRYAGEPAALLCLVARDAHGFAPAAEAFLATVAHYAALAIGNGVRFQEIQHRSAQLSRRAEQMERFVESSRLLHRRTTLADVMEDLVYAVQEGVGFDVVLLSLIEENDPGYNLHRVAAAGLPLDRLRALQEKPEPWSAVRRLAQERFALGQAYFVPATADVERVDVRLQHWDGPGLIPVDEAATSPGWHPDDLFFIVIRGSNREPLGTISLGAPRDGSRPDRNAARALELFANQAAIAVENIRLYHNTREYANQLQLIHDVSQQVLRELSLTGKLDLLVRGLLQLGWGRVALALCDERLDPVTFVSAGYDEAEEDQLVQAWPDGETWRRRFQDDHFLRFSVGSALFFPADDPWAREHLHGGRPSGQAPRPLASDWLQDDVFLVPLYDQKASLLALVSLDAPANDQRPDARALQIIELYARFAGSVIENARLFEETVRRERFSASLGRVGTAISATFDLPRVLELICQESLDIFSVDGAYIWRRHDDRLVGAAARGYAQRDFPAVEATMDDDDVFAVAVAQTGGSLVLSPFRAGGAVDFRLPAPESIQAALGVPLTQDGENVGVLVLIDRQDPFRFRQDDVELATRFGVQAAIAIRNATLVTELRDLNEQLDARVAERTQALGEERDRTQLLLRITTELSASLDEHFVLNRALALINEVAHAQRGGILMVDEMAAGMVCRAAFGLGWAVPREGVRLNLRPDEGLAGLALSQRRPVLVADTTRDEGWLPVNHAGAARSAMAVPLAFGEDTVGVLELFHDSPEAFSDEQLALVQAAAAQVSNALYNAQLYVLIQEQTEKLGKMWREEQIEAAKRQAILESILDGVLFADAAGIITLANQATSAVLSLPRRELLGRPVRELRGLYGASGEAWILAVDRWAAAPGQVGEGTVLMDRLTLDERFVAVTLAPVLDRGQFIGTVSVFRDITQAVEVDRMKSEFVSTVSHELRTPMTSIKGYADLILMGVAGPLSESQTQFVEVIRHNADRLSLLVNDLLDISRFETGKAELDVRPIDLATVVDQVVNGHGRGRIEHEKRALRLTTALPASMPLVSADDARVTQILTNLVDNAINYTPDGGTVTVGAELQDGFLMVSVKDTGIGIRPEVRQKIFDRFFRSEDERVQQVAGTGLGLAIVKTLVDMHGGTLTVESEPDRGSTFRFGLPTVTMNDEETL